jgi:hypothetical protein
VPVIVTFVPGTREGVVVPVPPFKTGSAVPEYEIARVPEVVMGEPDTDKKLGAVAATDVTVPPDAVGVCHVAAEPLVAVNTCPVVGAVALLTATVVVAELSPLAAVAVVDRLGTTSTKSDPFQATNVVLPAAIVTPVVAEPLITTGPLDSF